MSSSSPWPASPSLPRPVASNQPVWEDRTELQRLLDHGFPWLRFPPDLEARFQQDMVAQRLRHFLLSWLVALLV